MIPIAAPATKDVLALLRRGELEIDGLMVPQSLGPMATLLRSDFPDLPLYAHLSASLSDPSPLPGSVTDPIVEFVRLAETQWVSAHLGYNCSQVVRDEAGVAPAVRARRYVPAAARRTIVANVKLLRSLLGRSVVLENVAAVGCGRVQTACEFVCEPAFIRQVLEAADCELLLDIAHARVSAAHMGMDVLGYLDQLPLNRVAELHISGPRQMDGMLCDVHETLTLDDFEVLDWVLVRCRPRLVTLEYVTERGEIPEQLNRLRRACERRSE